MMKINTVRHYRRQKNGTLRFAGIEKVEVEEEHWGHIESLDWRDKADANRRAHEEDAFERLADSACGE